MQGARSVPVPVQGTPRLSHPPGRVSAPWDQPITPASPLLSRFAKPSARGRNAAARGPGWHRPNASRLGVLSKPRHDRGGGFQATGLGQGVGPAPEKGPPGSVFCDPGVNARPEASGFLPPVPAATVVRAFSGLLLGSAEPVDAWPPGWGRGGPGCAGSFLLPPRPAFQEEDVLLAD